MKRETFATSARCFVVLLCLAVFMSLASSTAAQAQGSCGKECAGSLVPDELHIVQSDKEQIAWMLDWTKDNFDYYKAHLDQIANLPIAKQIVENSLKVDFESFHKLVETESVKYFNKSEHASDYLHRWTKNIQLTTWGICMRACFAARSDFRGFVAWPTGEGPKSIDLTVGYLANSGGAESEMVDGVVEGGKVTLPDNVVLGRLFPPNFRIPRGDFKNVHIERLNGADITVSIQPGRDPSPEPIISLGPRPPETNPQKSYVPVYGELPPIKVAVKPYVRDKDEEGSGSWAGIGPRGQGVHFEYIAFRFDTALPKLQLRYWCGGFQSSLNDAKFIKSDYFREGTECSPGLDNTAERQGLQSSGYKIPITRFAMELEGDEKENYEIFYECYSPNYGTLEAANGKPCGTERRDFITGIRAWVKAKRNPVLLPSDLR